MVSGISHVKNNTVISNPVPVKVHTNPALERTPETDTIEIKKKEKKKLSKGAKWAIGVTGTFATLAAAGLALLAHKRHQIAKLYKEKLIISDLGENIQFREATTVEEGIKFAKEVLKISEVDSNFTLEAINEANKGLVKVSNANKGKLFMPRALRFHHEPSENWAAGVVRDIESKNFGELTINSSFFEHARLDNRLRNGFGLFYKEGSQMYRTLPNGSIEVPIIDNIHNVPSKEVMNLIEKYYQAPEAMSISEKRLLCDAITDGYEQLTFYQRAPIDFLKKLEAQPKYKPYVHPNYEELGKKTTEEQVKYVKDILKTISDNNKKYINKFDLVEPETRIYHEMGHLQDYAANLKQLNLAKWKFSNITRVIKDSWNNAKKDTNSTNSPVTFDEIGNHWGTIVSDKELEKFFKNKPDDFKKCFPDLYEFLTNQQYQQTAGKISAYAQSGIGEFIAEVYKNMIAGKTIPEDVKKLYEKYNGPKLP